jgi:hypothetical protein
MTKDEILSMASKSGFGKYAYEAANMFERFAALVAEKATEQANARQNASWALMCKKMVAAERELCAQVCERLPLQQEIDVRDQCADAIRARGQK